MDVQWTDERLASRKQTQKMMFVFLDFLTMVLANEWIGGGSN